MLKNYKTFITINLLILLTTLCIFSMYTYSINKSLGLVQADIQNSNLDKIQSTVNNLDHNVNQLNLLSIALDQDKQVSLLPSIDVMEPYDQFNLISDLSDKLHYQSLSEGWSNQLSIWSPLM